MDLSVWSIGIRKTFKSNTNSINEHEQELPSELGEVTAATCIMSSGKPSKVSGRKSRVSITTEVSALLIGLPISVSKDSLKFEDEAPPTKKKCLVN